MVNATDSLSALGLALPQQQKGAKKELGQQDFLTLMLAQIKAQDPMKPMANDQFLSQMAQFSTVSGIQGLQSSFASLSTSLQSNQSLQAASLVGRNAMVAANTMDYAGDAGVDGAVALTGSAQDVRVHISDASGALVRSIDLGNQSAGMNAFHWDGHDDAGSALPAGRYQVKVQGVVDGQRTDLDTYLAGQVQRVSLGTDGAIQLDLAGLGPVAFDDIRQIF